jgi:glycosyltransferase involved in cell wall biosynthesis
MKILWLSGYGPWPADHGGKIRLYNLVKQMLARGHSVDLWCVCGHEVRWSNRRPAGLKLRHFPAKSRHTFEEKITALLSTLPEPAWVVSTPEVEAELEALESSPPDVVILEQALVGSLARHIPDSIPYVLDAHNAEWWLSEQIARSTLRVPTRTRFSVDARKYVRLEAELMQNAAAVMVVSDGDAERLRDVASPRLLAVRPSGVDVDYFVWTDHSTAGGSKLLMTGTLGYAPNLDACAWIRSEIMPAIRAQIPDATVDLVGGAADGARELDAPDEGVHVVGPVPDVRAYLAQADVFIVPLRMGSGTRLKILEALAAGLPIVATSIAAEGLELPEAVILIADTVDDFADGVVRLVRDTELRSRMSAAGRRHVEQHFSWRDIAAGVESTLREAIAAHAGRPMPA